MYYTKICTGCHEEKPATTEFFYKKDGGKFGLMPRCKSCTASERKEYHIKNQRKIPEGYHVDHMIPLASGGFHHESNLCYLPAEINLSKGTKTIEEFGIDRFNQHVIYWQDHLGRGNDPLAHTV